MTLNIQLDAAVTYCLEEVVATVRDRRDDAISLFGELDDAQREQLVIDAWSIGLRALRNAHVTAQESKLKDIGASLVETINHQLSNHVDRQQETIGETLRRYFDPTDGQVNQ